MPNKDPETYCPTSRTDWREWLIRNHQSQQSVWLVYYKASSEVTTLSWSEAVDEALCFGWIDSTRRPIDNEKFMQYFSKRKAKSNWSRINKDKVKALIDQGHMMEAGYKSIEVAKENGSWEILDEIEALVIPEDLKKELANHKGAFEYFDSLSKSNKKILLHWVLSAKRPETRQKRFAEIAESARDNLKPMQFR
ncbi:YdeI/OmpD-associated family protein [uncultured Algoriphagus sp.]|uniref:YdeI/OmpD-associated family protein n=1 Tax=uncultured Algoriphagus sp. TaxID=417365 RepID=UPI0030EC8F1E